MELAFIQPVSILHFTTQQRLNQVSASAILYLLGSPGLSYFYWVIGFLLSASSLAVYLEYASYFPNRSGAEVVYLEQAYPRPRYLFPTTFALWYLILGFSSSNCIVLANYLFQINGSPPSSWELKGVAIAAWTVTILFLVFSTRISYWVSNAVGIIKVITLTFIAVTGLVVLGGHTRVEDPKANFRNSFSGTSDSPYGLATALVYIYFSYGGYNNAFNVVNEVKVSYRPWSFYQLFELTQESGPNTTSQGLLVYLPGYRSKSLYPRQYRLSRCSTT